MSESGRIAHVDRSMLLKGERQQRILELLAASGRVVATELQDVLGVSPYTVRRDLDELADAGRLQRVHGGALPRSPVAQAHEARRLQEATATQRVAHAAATLLAPGQVVILDGGSTALALADAIPAGHAGTFITHSPPVAVALGRHPGLEVVVIGGTLDRRAMVATGARTIAAYRRITADVCFVGVFAVHAERGISQPHAEEAEVRRVLLERGERVVGLASREALGTVAPFTVGPATALTHLATEPDVPAELLAPFAEAGVRIVRQ
jgi:DeoR/GlpR family transcriptional regulator of sugar metabolism